MKRALVLMLAVFAVFAVGITGTHLQLDDWGYTYGCAFVKGGFSFRNLLTALTSFNGGIWMPLTYISYMLDISVFGGGWPVHHAVNVFLHALNAVLVMRLLYAFAQRLCGEEESGRLRLACFFAALVWAVHPMKVEAVAWVASRKELLWTLFALLGCFGWLNFAERGGAWRYLLAFVLFIAACLSKPTAVCLPLLLALESVCLVRQNRRARWFHYLPFLAIAGLVGLIAYASQLMPSTGETVSVFSTSLGWRLLNAAVSLGLMILGSLLPIGLHLDYRAVFGDWPQRGWLGLSVLALSVVAFGYTMLKGSKGVRRTVGFAVGWALLGLLPVIGIFGTAGDKAYADRYAYLPSVVLALAVVFAFVYLSRRIGPRLASWLMFALVGAFVAVTIPYVGSFHDDYSVYRRVLAMDPDHWRALRVVGSRYCATENRMDEGLAMLRRSLRLRPSQKTADSLAYVLACRGTREDCLEVRRLGARVAAKPSLDRSGLMLDAIGIVSMRDGDDQAAVRGFSAALVARERSHGNLHAMLNLGLALANIGKDSDALEVLKKLENVGNQRIRETAAAAVKTISSNGPRRRFEVVVE